MLYDDNRIEDFTLVDGVGGITSKLGLGFSLPDFSKLKYYLVIVCVILFVLSLVGIVIKLRKS